jgi:hypothetical protein
MLQCRYYYKGYSGINTYSYYFENKTISRTAELQHPVSYMHQQGTIYDVYLKRWSDTQASVFDVLLGHELTLASGSTPEINKLYAHEAPSSYNLIDTQKISFDKKALFEYSQTGYSSFETLSQQKNFSFIEKLKNSKEVMMMDVLHYGQMVLMVKEGDTVPVSHSTLYKLIKATINGPDANHLSNGQDDAQSDSITKEQLWGHPLWNGKCPTWCNVFAQYLSAYIYGKVGETSIVPLVTKNAEGNNQYYGANDIFDFFNSSPHYKALEKNGEIWTKYINKGYPVYFSRKNKNESGHIETGFPANSGNDIWNNKVFGDSSPNINILKPSSNNLMVGAGGTVGYKSYDQYAFFTNIAIPFIALQYLNNEY